MSGIGTEAPAKTPPAESRWHLPRLLSVDEFLDGYADDRCELLGGETRPKPLGRLKHVMTRQQLQFMLAPVFGRRRVQTELSVKIGEDVPVPDLVVLQNEKPRLYRDALDEPPVLCVEVVSPSQTPSEMLAKCERYRQFGVPFCWVIDPVACRAWEYHLSQTEPYEVTGTLSGPCSVSLAEAVCRCVGIEHGSRKRMSKMENGFGTQSELMRELRDAVTVTAHMEAAHSRALKDHTQWLISHDQALSAGREQMKLLGERIDGLVSGFGEFIRQSKEAK
jgi:Uma2 family endonuclease